MNLLVTGGSKCGKSSFAESAALRLSEGSPVIYIATMKALDHADMEVVNRHKAYRSGKPFLVFECPKELDRLELPPCKAVILEDLPNLAANEMFDGGCVEGIMSQIQQLAGRTDNLILVTNEIDSDGLFYGEEVDCYMRRLGDLNVRCAAWCDTVVEFAAGIPILLKGARA